MRERFEVFTWRLVKGTGRVAKVGVDSEERIFANGKARCFQGMSDGTWGWQASPSPFPLHSFLRAERKGRDCPVQACSGRQEHTDVVRVTGA